MANNSPGLPVSGSLNLLFLLGGAAAAVAIGWASAMLSVTGKAPVGLLSLGIGIALGLLLVALAELTRFKSPRGLVVSVALCAVLTVLAEHGWLYRAYRQKWQQNRVEHPAVALFRPDDAPLTLAGYFHRELQFAPGQWKFWLVDGGLIVAGAVGVVILRNRSVRPTAGPETAADV